MQQPNTTYYLVFTFDEAKGLLKHDALWFRSMRSALREFAWGAPKQLFKICGIFTDTKSKVANFAPPTHNNSSSQLSENVFLKVFEPWSVFSNTDIFSDNILVLGRPIWGAYLTTGVNNCTVIQFAITKLQGGANGEWKDVPDKECTSLAILSSQVALSIVPQHHYSSELVSTYMGTCVGISKDRKSVLVEYSSEPILSEAAAQLMKQQAVYKSCLESLQ
eukprot:Phypoly_transcript_02523.p1 GENE.Phypoly_transcript_02523~~Phypoly_transcript_02523.p1  ORF type:complete len:220 (-),score=16.30 Phypoly_transcript_02523:1497-2156(-)